MTRSQRESVVIYSLIAIIIAWGLTQVGVVLLAAIGLGGLLVGLFAGLLMWTARGRD